MKTLFEECIDLLGDDVNKMSHSESNLILNKFQDDFNFTSYGQLDWSSVSSKTNLRHLSEILKFHGVDKSDQIYIIWDDAMFPVLKTHLGNVLKNIENVTAVSFDTWLFCKKKCYTVEFYHEGSIIFGNRRKSRTHTEN